MAALDTRSTLVPCLEEALALALPALRQLLCFGGELLPELLGDLPADPPVGLLSCQQHQQQRFVIRDDVLYLAQHPVLLARIELGQRRAELAVRLLPRGRALLPDRLLQRPADRGRGAGGAGISPSRLADSAGAVSAGSGAQEATAWRRPA